MENNKEIEIITQEKYEEALETVRIWRMQKNYFMKQRKKVSENRNKALAEQFKGVSKHHLLFGNEMLLPIRCWNKFREYEIIPLDQSLFHKLKVRDLENISLAKLMNIKGFGEKTLATIIALCKQCGVQLKL